MKLSQNSNTFQKRKTKNIFSKATGIKFLSLLLFLPLSHVIVATELNDLQRCFLNKTNTATEETLVGEIRKICSQTNNTVDSSRDVSEPVDINVVGGMSNRVASDKKNSLEPYSLLSHKPNYYLVASHNFSGNNPAPFQQQFNDPNVEMQDTEAKFQFSIRIPLQVGLFDDSIDVFAAYTNRSFWQMYNTDNSSPFRETNHEPEIWVQSRQNWQFAGFNNRINSFGIVHQSNGRGGSLSRSWNRIYASFLLERNNLVIGIKPWYRIPESNVDDDNPDINEFLGYGELRTAYKSSGHSFSLMVRNLLESNLQLGTVELGWSFPIGNYPYLKGYVQYFNGFGEGLIDYNTRSNSLGIGVLITDWL